MLTLTAATQSVSGTGTRNDTVSTGSLTTLSGTINLGAGTDTLAIATSTTSTGISTATLTSVEAITLDSNVGATMTIAQNALITTASGTNTVTLSDAGTATAASQVESYVLANGTNSFTFAADTAQTVVGGTGADTINVTLGDAVVPTPGAVVTSANLGSDSMSDTVVINNSGGASAANSVNNNNVSGYISVSNFNASHDVLKLLAGGTALNTNFQTFSASGTALLASQTGSVWEIESTVAGTLSSATGLSTVKNLIAAAVGTAMTSADDLFGVVLYTSSGAALYNIKVGAVGGADLQSSHISAIELVGLLDGVTSNALGIGNFG